MREKIVTTLFCVMLAVGMTLPAVLPDRTYSENEKRMLTQWPAVSWGSISSGKFSAAVEKYLADQFPGRDGWVTVRTGLELAAGQREVNGVYLSKDGYLIDAFSSYDQQNYERNLASLAAWSSKVHAVSGLDVKVMLVPTAAEILTDKLPAHAPHASQAAMISQARAAGLDVVDVEPTMREHAAEYIYYRTDHHFTSLGAYYCYAAWCAATGRQAVAVDRWQTEELCTSFQGTSWAKVNFRWAASDTITAYYLQDAHHVVYNGGTYTAESIYERRYLEGKDQYATFFNSNQAQTVIDGSGQGRLLIIKDSYANTFGQFVIDGFEQTHLLDMRFFKGSVSEYIKDNGITEVLVLYGIANLASDTALAKIG